MTRTVVEGFDPRYRIRAQTFPGHDRFPATSFSLNESGLGNGDEVWLPWQHSPLHLNRWHSAVGIPPLSSDPVNAHLIAGDIQPRSAAARKGSTTSAFAPNDSAPNQRWGLAPIAWHPELYDMTRGPGATTHYQAGTSDYWVHTRHSRAEGIYLEAPPAGTGVMLRPATGRDNHGVPIVNGLHWSSTSPGTARLSLRGPTWLRRGHPIGVPLTDEWCWYGDENPFGEDGYTPGQLQVAVKFAITGMTSLKDVAFGGEGVSAHGEYLYCWSPMPDPSMPSLGQQALDLGPNWGHERNVWHQLDMPMPRTLTPRKAEGVGVIIREPFAFPLQHEPPWDQPDVPDVDPLDPPPVDDPGDGHPEPADPPIDDAPEESSPAQLIATAIDDLEAARALLRE